MRIGHNPNRDTPTPYQTGLHRVVIPVYIPNEDGYFAGAVEILRLCLASLRLTKTPDTRVTLVSNGCCERAVRELTAAHQDGWIDELVLKRENAGKVDAIMCAARGSFEPLITFADADVLFRPGWEAAVLQVFNAFPAAGMVSPTPCLCNDVYAYTSATQLGAILNCQWRLRKVVDDEDAHRFARSIDWATKYTAADLARQLIVQRDNVAACIGATHFVCTTRREVLRFAPASPSRRAIGSRSEPDWLDIPPDRGGYWRLSTPKAYAWHLGNVPEPWMHEELARLSTQAMPTEDLRLLAPSRRGLAACVPWWLRRKIAFILRKSRGFGLWRF